MKLPPLLHVHVATLFACCTYSLTVAPLSTRIRSSYSSAAQSCRRDWCQARRQRSTTTAVAAATNNQPEAPESLETITGADDSKDNNLLERYKNRALVLQHVLQEKLSQLARTNDKVVVLQNVTLQLKSQQQDMALQLETERKQRFEVEHELQMAATDYETTTAKLQAELTELRRDRDAASAKSQQSALRIKALQMELLDMDQHLEETNAKLMILKQQSDRNTNDHQLRERKLQQQVTRLQKEELLAQQEQSLEKEAAQEQVQIAVASVQAADKREQALRHELEQLRAKVERLELENVELLSNQSPPVAADDTDETKQQRHAGIAALQQKVDRLNEQVRSMRLTHAAELSSWKRKASDSRAESSPRVVIRPTMNVQDGSTMHGAEMSSDNREPSAPRLVKRSMMTLQGESTVHGTELSSDNREHSTPRLVEQSMEWQGKAVAVPRPPWWVRLARRVRGKR